MRKRYGARLRPLGGGAAAISVILPLVSTPLLPMRADQPGGVVLIMSENEGIVAQVVLRRADGRSILDSGGAVVAENVEQFRVEGARIEEATRRLQRLGFKVEAHDPYTLSVRGSPALFRQVFGVAAPPGEQTAAGSGATRVDLPDTLSEYVADVIFPPAPEFFP